MRRVCLGIAITIAILAIFASAGLAQDGPYKVLKAAKVGGEGGFDYVYADAGGRQVFMSPGWAIRPAFRSTIWTLRPWSLRFPISAEHGAAVDPKSGHGFASSNPVAMWDTKTLKLIKTIRCAGRARRHSF